MQEHQEKIPNGQRGADNGGPAQYGLLASSSARPAGRSPRHHRPSPVPRRHVDGPFEARILVAVGDVEQHVVREASPGKAHVVRDLDPRAPAHEPRPEALPLHVVEEERRPLALGYGADGPHDLGHKRRHVMLPMIFLTLILTRL